MVNIAPLPLPGFDPLSFFAKLDKENAPAYFTSGRWTVIAWNPRKSIISSDIKKIQALAKHSPRRSSRSKFPFTGGMIGYVSYDLGLSLHGIRSKAKDIVKLPHFAFHFYRKAVLFDGKTVFALGNAAFRRNVAAIHARSLPEKLPPTLDWRSSLTRSEYNKSFRVVEHGIRAGEYYQMNLTYPFEAHASVDARHLFTLLARRNPAACASYIETKQSAILSLSPERFVTVDGDTIVTRPIKGTKPRGKNPAQDKKFMQELLSSEKEAAELNMITDLLRNDIGKVSRAGSVEVTKHRHLQKNPSVWHTFSEIQGRLLPDISPLGALLSMFPGGSVTGCPKVAAMKEIDRLERFRRGSYCGSMVMQSADGFFDSSILIRTVVAKKKRLSLGVGGGIVADSIGAPEWEETLQKARNIIRPLRRTWIDGKEIHSDDPRLTALDPSNRKIVGVFETMRADNGRIRFLSSHLRRLQSSAEIIGMRLPAHLRKIRASLTAATREGSLRVKTVCTKKHIFIETRPLEVDPALVQGIAVRTVRMKRRVPGAKALPYYLEWKAHAKAIKKGAAEALLLGKRGQIPEAAYANLFWVKKGMLHTSSDALPGVTRAIILRIAKKKKIPIQFETPRLADLLNADEVFLTRSTAGVIPVIRINGNSIAQGRPGPLTMRFSHEWSAL